MIERTEDSAFHTVITTHLNADFDALASALAASILFPGSKIVLPGSQEKTLRDFLEGRFPVPSVGLPLERLRNIDLAAIKRLVIVDTCQRDRIGAFATLLDRPDIEVLVFDHHGPDQGDIPADRFTHRPVGANTTMMVGFLADKKAALSPAEATFLAMGIYEDTGSFTFKTTTPEDIRAVAWLLEQGADLKAATETLSHRMTPEHVEILDDLLHNAHIHHMGGASIAVAKTALNEYFEDFALFAHEIIDMKNLDAVFTLALMNEQVLVVGRSRAKSVDVAEILKPLGGGGHPVAASATLRGLTLLEAEERLLTELHRNLGDEAKVRDIMSAPVLSVTPVTTLDEAHDHLTRFGITVLPVVQDGAVLGLISRRTVEKALYHKLHSLPVREYMTTEFLTIRPDDTLLSVQDIIVAHRQRFLPVVEEGRIVGVITRTDLLQILSGDRTRQPEPLLEDRPQSRNLAGFLKEKLDRRVYDLLVSAGRVAERTGCQVYVVGGFVRDLLLRVPNLDVDLVVEGDGIGFAEAFALEHGGRVRAHRAFGTAVVILPDGFKVDVATARWEYYEYPAAMPTVSLSSIKLDLYRRDFTINTLAIRLNPREFGKLLDFFGAQRDLKDGVIMVLHSLSFVEDPTRVFRAVRFEQRYLFRIGKQTLKLIQNALALNVFARLSGKRLLGELKLLLEEPDPGPAIDRCSKLELLGIIHPRLALAPSVKEVIARTYDVLAWYTLLFTRPRPRPWIVYLLALFSGLEGKDLIEAVDRLGLNGPHKAIFTKGLADVRRAEAIIAARDTLPGSGLHALLGPLALELVLHMLAATRNEKVRVAISRYITDLRTRKTALTGNDLAKMGFTPGPLFGAILKRLLAARMDDEVHDRKEELALVKREFPQAQGDAP